jgi:hypothetical protein
MPRPDVQKPILQKFDKNDISLKEDGQARFEPSEMDRVKTAMDH